MASTQCCHSPRPNLQNLTELVWGELFVVITSLVKFLAGPNFLLLLPETSAQHDSTICPIINVWTSFTIVVRDDSKADAIARYTSDVVRKWPHLQVLKSNAFLASVVEVLASKRTVHTLNIEVDHDGAVCNVGKLPDSIHTVILVAYGTWSCLECLRTIQGSLVHFHLQIVYYPCLYPSVDAIFETLPAQLDITRLRFLTIELAFEHALPDAQKPFLTEPHLESLSSFSALHPLDLSLFRTSNLSDAVYAQMAPAWPELRCLKMGTVDSDISHGMLVASVGAVIAVLRSCPHLQTLHIMFDGSIPPPCPSMDDEESSASVERVEEGEEQEMVGANKWGVSNAHITQIDIGHSPTGMDVDELKDLATCLRSVMPRLRTIQSEKKPSLMAERGRMVQHMLVGDVLEVSTDRWMI